jgi:radical SAM protein with 4Fe4S-binding SPASM domain
MSTRANHPTLATSLTDVPSKTIVTRTIGAKPMIAAMERILAIGIIAAHTILVTGPTLAAATMARSTTALTSMRVRSESAFDNVALRFRDSRCVAASVNDLSQLLYWPDFGRLAAELGFSGSAAKTALEPKLQAQLLLALAKQSPECSSFAPRKVGFPEDAAGVRQRQLFRRRHRRLICLGGCSRTAVLGCLEALLREMAPGGSIDVHVKKWDALTDWDRGQELIANVLNYLYRARGSRGEITVFSSLGSAVDSRVLDFIYEHPVVRVAFQAWELADCGSMEDLWRLRERSGPLKRLQELSCAGLWPHVVLPVSSLNCPLLPDLILALRALTRGGTIEPVPTSFFRGAREEIGAPKQHASTRSSSSASGRDGRLAPPPSGEEYGEALLAVYQRSRIPLRSVALQGWVGDRIDSQAPFPSSHAAAGAEVAVLPSGDMYAGEFSVGVERWHLGNVLRLGDRLQWEKLDAMPEVFGNSSKPAKCHQCDWRYRCGGLDASVALLQEQGSESPGFQSPSLFELYCEPRKTLFEALIWGAVEVAERPQARTARERIALGVDGIRFEPAIGL